MATFHITQGPPGTGKTTHIGQVIDSLIAAGEPESSIVVCSLTRTAAYEARGRVDIPEKHVGTWHSFAMRAVHGKEPLDKNIRKFNRWMADHDIPLFLDPYYSDPEIDDEESIMSLDRNATDMRDYMKYRALMDESRLAMLREESEIVRRYEEFKLVTGQQDFQDWIDEAAKAPCFNGLGSQIKHCLVDEAQDMSPSEYHLLECWSRFLENVYLVGDPMQALYRFRGASPLQYFVGRDTVVLSRSYRLPRLPWLVATRFAKECPEYIEQPYTHRIDADGLVPEGNIANISGTQDVVAVADDALCDGKSAMFLATTAQGVEDFKYEFYRQGIPFHNLYRERNRAWNPLDLPIANLFKATLSINIKLNGNAAKPFLSKAKLAALLKLLPVRSRYKQGHVVEGALDNMEKVCSTDRGSMEYLCENRLISKKVREMLLLMKEGGPIDWMEIFFEIADSKNNYKNIRYLEYYRKVFTLYGNGCFIKDKKSRTCVTLGTCHSVKGGTADVVVLSTHLSKAQARVIDEDDSAGESDVVRTLYVGATRTRDELYIYSPDLMCPQYLPLRNICDEIDAERKQLAE